MAVQHRGSNWTPDEDRLLRNLVEAGKSWVFISANLKRPTKTVRYRMSVLRHQDASSVETRAKGRPKRSKGTWYVSFEPNERLSGKHHRHQPRITEPFRNEQEAKAFAKTKLAERLNVSAGTLNPHQPKRTIASAQMFDWLNEPND